MRTSPGTDGMIAYESARHTSTNSAFGTLDVALPSKHSQLDMEIAHDGVEASFSTANLSQYDISATAWVSQLVPILDFMLT